MGSNYNLLLLIIKSLIIKLLNLLDVIVARGDDSFFCNKKFD